MHSAAGGCFMRFRSATLCTKHEMWRRQARSVLNCTSGPPPHTSQTNFGWSSSAIPENKSLAIDTTQAARAVCNNDATAKKAA